MTATVGTKLGRYDIVSCLARSGIADLVLARTSGLGGFERHVVIKRLRPEHAKDQTIVEMFVSGARLASALQHHHNIVQVHDVDEAGGTPYMAMEYLHGEDIRTLLAALQVRQEQLPLEHVIAIGPAIATALQQAHDRRIVHGAVTPTNVIVTYDGNVKVTDFGVSAAAIRPVDTQSGSTDGQISYMSPEQCTGRKLDARSDVFALGTLLYELVTVRRLFKGATTFLTMSAIVEGDIPRPSTYRKDLPAALDAIIMKSLARDPEQRFQTAQQLGDALEAISVTRRTPVSGLTRYMTQLFGGRPEPWLVEGGTGKRDIPVDFGDAPGLAQPPPAATESCTISPSVVTGARSPIARARSRALARTTGPGVDAVVLVPPRTPPAPPITATTRVRAENTVVVRPLPAPALDGVPVPAPPHDPTVAVRAGRRRWIGGGILAAAACIAVAAVVMIPGFARPGVADTPGTQEPPVADPPRTPAVTDPALETKPFEQLTARDLERERAAAVASTEPNAAPADIEAKPIADERKPITSDPNPVVAAKPVADEPKPPVVEPKPVADEPKPPVVAAKPVADEPKPRVVAAKPVADGPKPRVVEPKTVADKPKPPVVAAKPVADEPKPRVVAPKPVAVDANAPVVAAKPVAVEAKPPVAEPVAVAKPVAVDPPVARPSRPARPIAARPRAKAVKAAPKWDPDSLLPKK